MRSYARPKATRTSTLIVVAAEGAVTERDYFIGLGEKIHNSRIRFKFLEKDQFDGSCPVRVVDQIDKFKRNRDTVKGDQFWVVVDADGPHNWKLVEAEKLCKDKNINLAISNPCFEIWVLFHSLVDAANLSEESKTRILDTGKTECCRLINKHAAVPANVSAFDFEVLWPSIEDAVRAAKVMDTDSETRLPERVGSRVYRLIDNIFEAIGLQK